VSDRQVFINSDGQLGTLPYSARYKRDIRDMREGSEGLYQLRPVTFRYKRDPQGQRQYGLIAEEVAKVYPELVTKGADGKVESVQYHELIPMLLNEVQHQQQKLEAQSQQLSAQSQQLVELKAQNERLQAALAQQTTALTARLEQLEKAPHVAAVATR
jgi:polyhydroxyalkanoate synthesis regulator phasin